MRWLARNRRWGVWASCEVLVLVVVLRPGWFGRGRVYLLTAWIGEVEADTS